MNSLPNPLLEARLESLRESLDAFAGRTDENLCIILHRLTCDKAVLSHGPLHPVEDLARHVRERCLILIARQQPVAHDLKYAMGALRVGHDYERIYELAEALNSRIERLRGSPIQGVIQDMTGVMANILELHDLVRRTWQRNRAGMNLPDVRPEVKVIVETVHSGVNKVQHATMEAIGKGQGSPELLVELVLACRHLKRISNLLEAIPEELHSFE